MHLGFKAYDFSYIPLETLSVIYEQFLHAEKRDDGRSKAEEKSAYYMPVHLVNFMLDELEDRKSLGTDGTVLDPACGSGAFLVQAYRRMIEQAQAERGPLRPVELRDLLTRRVFGIDQDRDACQVAGLSLSLTLLDYIEPPDLGGRYKGKYSSNPPHTKPTQPFHLRGRKKICCFFMESDKRRKRQENSL